MDEKTKQLIKSIVRYVITTDRFCPYCSASKTCEINRIQIGNEKFNTKENEALHEYIERVCRKQLYSFFGEKSEGDE